MYLQTRKVRLAERVLCSMPGAVVVGVVVDHPVRPECHNESLLWVIILRIGLVRLTFPIRRLSSSSCFVPTGSDCVAVVVAAAAGVVVVAAVAVVVAVVAVIGSIRPIVAVVDLVVDFLDFRSIPADLPPGYFPDFIKLITCVINNCLHVLLTIKLLLIKVRSSIRLRLQSRVEPIRPVVVVSIVAVVLEVHPVLLALVHRLVHPNQS